MFQFLRRADHQIILLHFPAKADLQRLGVPVKFAGVGEGADDLRVFNAREFAEAMLQ